MVALDRCELEDPRVVMPESGVVVDDELEGGPDVEAAVHGAAFMLVIHQGHVITLLSVECSGLGVDTISFAFG